MGKSRDRGEEIQAIQEGIRGLPEELQKALNWAIDHWELVEWLCKGSEMTDEEMEREEIKAIKKEDYLLFVLVCAAQVFKDNSKAVASDCLTSVAKTQGKLSGGGRCCPQTGG